ncbi:hypothetical protein [Phytoactinopolyspora halotolerans]|uniref:Uncharacterized protein n=1 Tax=Phytoactinopolyspora halotolerans TaxID=1981512 RepID=A0A6L9SDW4_9ACTN|nr:hypothetical protein [Phytoactinopolyspora halotolerans]NEE02702.1 hypothetical protein [Phytoactinopolyspora halotolerans]
MQASRLRSALREITDPADLIACTRGRAKVHPFTGHPAAVTRLVDMMAVADYATLGLASSPIGPDAAKGYLPAGPLDATVWPSACVTTHRQRRRARHGVRLHIVA